MGHKPTPEMREINPITKGRERLRGAEGGLPRTRGKVWRHPSTDDVFSVEVDRFDEVLLAQVPQPRHVLTRLDPVARMNCPVRGNCTQTVPPVRDQAVQTQSKKRRTSAIHAGSAETSNIRVRRCQK